MGRFFFLLIPIAIACTPVGQQPSRMQFNCDSLINRQVTLLSNQPASVKKFTRVSGSEADTQVRSNQVNWSVELAPFRVISRINNPIYQANYKVTVAPDPKSNLTIKSWTAINSAPVLSLKVYYLNGSEQIKRIEAVMAESNFVFTSRQTLQLDFNLLGENPRLEHYQISGSQKFLLGNIEDISVDCVVKPENAKI
jgi:hypothetical protein